MSTRLRAARSPAWGLGAFCCLVGLLLFFGTPARQPAVAEAPVDADAQYHQQISPLLKQYCYACHGNGQESGGLALDSYPTVASIMQDAASWETVQRYVHTHEMPPQDHPQPSEEQRRLIAGWVDGQLSEYFQTHADPGRVTIHRLNRAEYDNTVRDLVGVNFHPAQDFPPDDAGYGFDNVGDAMSLPPVLMEKYLAAADTIMDQAIVTDPIISQKQHIPASVAQVGFNAFGDRGDGWVKLVSLEDDDVAVELPILAAGDYMFRVQAYATPDGGVLAYDDANAFQKVGEIKAYMKDIAEVPPTMSILLNDAMVKQFAVTTDAKHPGVYETRIGVAAGRQRFRAGMRRVRGGANELYMKNGRLGKEQPGVIFVKYLEIEGPLPCATVRYPGEQTVTIDAAKDGSYILRAQACATQAGDEPARMELRIDGSAVKTFDVLAPARMQSLANQHLFSPALLAAVPQVYEAPIQLKAGRHTYSAAFVNPFSDPTNANPNLRQRALMIQHLEVVDLEGTVPTPPMPRPIAKLFHKRPEARQTIADFAFRAWRRPPSDKELDRLMALYTLASSHGDSFNAAVKLPMKAVLASPKFLFRGELQPEPDNPGSVHPIDDYALASRLSYFLWSTMPDDTLLVLAREGHLRAHLHEQVARMLADPKASALVDNFGGQWLQFRSMDTVAPDATVYEGYDAALRSSMETETRMFFAYVMHQDRSVLDFVNGDYTFVNDRLAKLYDIPGVSGEEFRKVSLAGTPRRGILTQGSVLTLTSNPTRTSPVKRGKWVLENLLGSPPPPPPPEVPALDDEAKTISGTLRHQMEVHRANPNCASCHARMDPIGFGLENFDGIGAFRTEDGDYHVDPAGKLLSGESFTTPLELVNILATSHREDYLRCVTEKMLTYALGRGVEVYDHAAIDTIIQGMEEHGDRFSALVNGVVDSVPFQMRRGEGGE